MSRRSKKKTSPKQAATPPQTERPGFAVPEKWVALGVCVLLGALVWAVFGQTLGHDFVNYDDNIYVYENPYVAAGLSLGGIGWAFHHSDLLLWTPLTTLSHMLDCGIFMLNPWGHHLVNVLLHMASVVALFLVLRQMTGALWRSAFVAAVFAIHPLRVESVAWVSERKDVLSGLFFVLTLGAYLRYVRGRSVARYLPVVVLFALGILAKQMVVTLPFVLLLLDYWPLKRFAETPEEGDAPVFFRLFAEKIPLFVLSAASCVQTYLAGNSVRAVVSVAAAHPLSLRAANALVSYFVYIGQAFYPENLVPLYPFPTAVPVWQALGALALLAGISIAAFAWRKKHPAFLTGWFWYAGMLVPVIGLVPLGREAHADRYTYLPQIGLAIAITWLCADACARLRIPRAVPGIAMAAAVAALAICAHAQASHWKNDETLWTYTLGVNPDIALAHNNLGLDCESDGDSDGAIAHYTEALALQPDYADARNNMGNALFDKHDIPGAIVQYRKALKISPDHPRAHNYLGYALLESGDVEDAIAECRKAIASDPDYVEALNNLGNALSARGETPDMEEAITHYRRAIEIRPDYAKAHGNLANTLLLTGRPDEAIPEYEMAVQLDPDLANAQSNLGNLLIRKGRVREALAHLEKALEIKPGDMALENNLARVLATCPQDSLRNGARALKLALQASQSTMDRNPVVLRTLAEAYAETGQYAEAVRAAQLALQMTDSESNAELADLLRFEIKLYQTGTPFRDASLADSSSK